MSDEELFSHFQCERLSHKFRSQINGGTERNERNEKHHRELTKMDQLPVIISLYFLDLK